MIEVPQEEHLLTSYDHHLVQRISALAAPYWRMLTAAALCLVVATAGEMLIPVLIQRTVDHVILEGWLPLEAPLDEQIAEEVDLRTVGERQFLREQSLEGLSRAARDAVRQSGTVGNRRYLLVPEEVITISPELTSAVLEVPHVRGREVWAVSRDHVARMEREYRRALRGESVARLRTLAGIFLAVLIVVLAGSFGQVYLTALTGQMVMRSLRVKLFRHAIDQHLGFLATEPVGKLVTRVTNDVETINELFTSVLSELTRNIGLMIAVVITMVALNSRLAFLVLLTMIPVVLLTSVIRRLSRRVFRRVREAVSRVNAYLSEYIAGISLVQLFGQETRSAREFHQRNDGLMHANLQEMYLFAVFRPVVDFLASVSLAAMILLGAWLLEADIVSLGTVIAFTNLIRRFYMPVMSISEQFTVLQSAMAGSERVFSLLDNVSRIPDEGTFDLDDHETRGDIQFDGVHFAYKANEPVLQGLSFHARPGQFVAVVGATGAGKTTIINLLTRLWDVTGGSILLDGRDIRTCTLSSLRRNVQQIHQEVFLFNDTIRNNITLGMDVPDELIWAACEAVQIAPFIRRLPGGLDTPLEERGENLSSGQRQLISFARVLVHDPPVLVLDEATSSIDSETERLLQTALTAITGGRTSLVVAHRLSTIRHADVILVLSRGKLAESGTHEELMLRNGIYATLYHLQFENQ